MEIAWKLLIKFLKCKDKPYYRAVKCGQKVFVVSVEEFESTEQVVKRKNALE